MMHNLKTSSVFIYMNANWSDSDIHILKKNYASKTCRELTEIIPHHSLDSIRGKIDRLKLRKGHYIDYSNRTIGALHIIKRIFTKDTPTPLWEADCSCGTKIEITSYSLRHMKVPSCGCSRPPMNSNKNPQERTIDVYLQQYQQRCIRDNIVWKLSKEEFLVFIKQNCHYCNIPPSRIINVYSSKRFQQTKSLPSRQRHKHGQLLVNGIDRVDSNKGYTIDNCVTCCKDCNYGKLTKTRKEFLDWINRIWIHQHKTQPALPL